MDPSGLRGINNEKGLALIWVALLMVVFCGFLGLAIDIGYMYVAKTELQNAADAAALAGVVKLKTAGTQDLLQAEARAQAATFANQNTAAGLPVQVVTDNSNSLGEMNDITVGHWNGTSYAAGATPVNAIQTRARRTEDSPNGDVGLFFSRVIGWDRMGASAEAVAGLTIKATNYFSFCSMVCPGSGSSVFVPPVAMDASNDGTNTSDFSRKFAWTTLSDASTANSRLVDMICKEPANSQVCGIASGVYTTMGTDEASLKAMEWAFYNPNFDADNKTYLDAEKTQVRNWTVIVPVTDSCPPGAQGQWDPHQVSRYARVEIVAICASGVGQPCRQTLPEGAPYENYHSPSQACRDYPNNTVVISSISCSSCGENVPGLKPSLLR